MQNVWGHCIKGFPCRWFCFILKLWNCIINK
jgi:hypothetical protein